MIIRKRARLLIGQPVGITLRNGTGQAGVLCGIQNGKLLVIEFIVRDFFALKQIPIRSVAMIRRFPRCKWTHRKPCKCQRPLS